MVRRRIHFDLRVLSLATLVIVVLVLAVLQYRWIAEVNEAQDMQAKAHLREQIQSLSDAFDTEVTRAALAFELPPPIGESASKEVERSWAKWNRQTRWPRIVLDVSLVESADSGWSVRSLGDSGPIDVRAVLPHVPGVATSTSGQRTSVFTGNPNQAFFADGHPSLLRLLPSIFRPITARAAKALQDKTGEPRFKVYEDAEMRMNWLLIRFNERYLRESLFPQLLKEHSNAEDRNEFQFEVTAGKVQSTANDIMVTDLFHFRPDCLMTGGGVSTAVSISGNSRRRLVGGSSGITVASLAPVTQAGNIQDAPTDLLLEAAGHCQIPPDPGDKGLMQLVVRRRGGPVSAAFARLRWRNELVSIVVLAILLLALATLVVSTERARKLAHLQTVVAAGISHELRTPLASLRIAADDLKSGHVENVEQARRYGEIINAQSRRLGWVVDQALGLASITQPSSASSVEPVAVFDIVVSLIAAMSPQLVEAKIRLESRVEPDVPRILAEPESVLRCLTNLIENSIKYAAPGGLIVLSAQATRHSGRSVVELTVEDRGPGIEEDEADSVFEPFFRGRSARLSRQPGSGLGLAIVKGIVERQGGSIELVPAVPHGCRFRLFFDAEEEAVPSSAAREVAT